MIVKSFSLRHAISVSIAVVLAVYMDAYTSFSHHGWIILTAFLVCQTTRGTPLRQSLICLFIIIFALLLSSILLITIKQTLLIDIVLGGTFIIAGYIAFLNWFYQGSQFYFIVLFPLILLIATLMPGNNPLLIQSNVLDVILGGVIGILCGLFVLPVKLDKEFRQGLLPLLRALLDYSQIFTICFLQNKKKSEKLIEAKQQIEKSLLIQHGFYPEWVYEVGFNPGLRSGFRFFLIHLERMTEIFFSMDYLMTRHISTESISDAAKQELAEAVANVMKKNEELIKVLLEFLEHHRFIESSSDFIDDIQQLESALQRVLPSNLDLLDLSESYLTFAALVRDIKDLRNLLLQLTVALPTQPRSAKSTNI